MILDYAHTSIRDLTSDERRKMQQGLCPKCGNNAFKIEENIASRALTRLGASLGVDAGYSCDFVVCIQCDYTSDTNIFRPNRIATLNEVMEVNQKKEAERNRIEAERRKNEEIREQNNRKTEYARLLRFRDTASSEDDFFKLFEGFKSLSRFDEYKNKGVEAYSAECEEEYLVLKHSRLMGNVPNANTEDALRNLAEELKQLARDFRNLANRKKRIPKMQPSNVKANIINTPVISEIAQKSIVGKWEGYENGKKYYWIYSNDGYFETNHIFGEVNYGRYKLEDEKLTLTCDLGAATITMNVSDNLLTHTLPNETIATFAKAHP